MRRNIIAKVSFGILRFTMEMFENDWGPEDPILDQALKGSFDENVSLAWWAYFAALAPSSSTFVDVGAYSGLFSLVVTSTRYDLHVVAMEPSAITWGRLVRNLQLNLVEGRVLAANIAAWKKNERITFRHPFGIYTMCPGESSLGLLTMDHSVSVQAVCLNSFVGQKHDLPEYLNSSSYEFLPTRNVAAIKIDVEGAEPEVLEGANALIEQARPFVICEALSEIAKQNLFHAFDNRGYKAVDIPQERNLIFIPEEKFDVTRIGFVDWSEKQQSLLSLKAETQVWTRIG